MGGLKGWSKKTAALWRQLSSARRPLRTPSEHGPPNAALGSPAGEQSGQGWAWHTQEAGCPSASVKAASGSGRPMVGGAGQQAQPLPSLAHLSPHPGHGSPSPTLRKPVWKEGDGTGWVWGRAGRGAPELVAPQQPPQPPHSGQEATRPPGWPRPASLGELEAGWGNLGTRGMPADCSPAPAHSHMGHNV